MWKCPSLLERQVSERVPPSSMVSPHPCAMSSSGSLVHCFRRGTGPRIRQWHETQTAAIPTHPHTLAGAYRTRQPHVTSQKAAHTQTSATAMSIAGSSHSRPDSTELHGPGGPESLITEQLLEDHRTMFSSLLYEYEYWVDASWVEGTIPKELQGTYFRNGPGLQCFNPKYERHIFDGDGMVLSLAFHDGAAYFRNKFVRTRGFKDEQAAGKPIHRNSFSKGTADGSLFFNPLDLSFKNVANTGVVYWGGRLLALWEVGCPYELNPITLETLGETTLDGQIQSKLAGHYRVVTEPDGSKRWVTFSTDVGLGGSKATFYEFDEAGRKVASPAPFPLQGVDICFVHDMVVTENYYVLVMGPIEFNMAKFFGQYMLGKCSIAQCLEYNGALQSKVMLFPRPGRPNSAALKPRVLQTVPFFPFHHVNAFEVDGGRQVVVDTIGWDEVSFDIHRDTLMENYLRCAPGMIRVVCNLESNSVQASRLLQQSLEFPTMNTEYTGKPYCHSYFTSDKKKRDKDWGPAQALLKVSVPADKGTCTCLHTTSDVWYERWEAGPRCFLGEPMFVGRPGAVAEDDGWVIVATHDAAKQRADVLILDAQRISEGPVATIHLPHALPASLHGSFTPTYLGPDQHDASVPAWKEPHRIQELL